MTEVIQQSASEAAGLPNRSDAELAQEALENKTRQLNLEATKHGKHEVTSENIESNQTNAVPVDDAKEVVEDEEVEEEMEEEGEEEEEEEEDPITALGRFTKEVMDDLGMPAEPLSEEERKPRPLPAAPRDLRKTIRLLQDLINFNGDEPDLTYGLESLDSLGQLSATGHLLSAALTTLHPTHLRRLATRLLSDTSLWLSRLFRKFESATCLHDELREGVVRVGRMLLHSKYPRYATDGHHALYTRPPLLYVSATAHTSLPTHLATALGLGSSSVRVVPCNTVVGSPTSMDAAALERMLAEDLAAQKRPLMVIANCGGGVVGGVDNVARLQEVCHAHDVWLHVEGHNLAALALPNTPNLPASVGDSMTLPLGVWLGIPALPFVTVYRVCEAACVHAAGLTTLNLHVRLDALELWLTLQTLGSEGVVSRLQAAFSLAQQLQHFLAAQPRIRLLSPRPAGVEPYVTIQDLVTKPISTTQLLETVCGTVVFQYVPDDLHEGRNSEYYDNLNSWLGQVVRREVCVPLELVSLDGAGLVLRWSPLEGPATHHLTRLHLQALTTALQHQIDILNATVKQREVFSSLVASSGNLQLAEIPQWAGLGGVRYVPDLWLGQGPLPDSAKQEVNFLNSHLVERLKASDSAFSLGEGSDGLGCVRFGMVTEDTDLQELLTLVLSTGREIESSSKFLEQMTQVVKKGIETATEDLRRENDERLWNEGLLRHVPLFGSVYNWLSPPPQQGIRGRTLDLNAGILESTENIYKYHMQIRHGTVPSHGDGKLPPAPSVQTSVTPTPPPSTSSHSRNSSAASTARPLASTSTASTVSTTANAVTNAASTVKTTASSNTTTTTAADVPVAAVAGAASLVETAAG